jgi:hypothetical protein
MREQIKKIMVELADGRRFQWDGTGVVLTAQTYVKDDKDQKTYFKTVEASMRLEDIEAPKA